MVQKIQVKLLNGITVSINSNHTFNELLTKVSAELIMAENELDIYVNGKKIAMADFGCKKLQDYNMITGNTRDIVINIGRTAKTKTMIDVVKLDKELVDATMKKTTAPTPVLRGYTGHIPGRKYSYGLASSLSDKDHMLPPEIADIDGPGFKYGEDIVLGYKGFIRGSQHVAARTHGRSLAEAKNTNYDELAKGSILPIEPQHYANRNFSLTNDQIGIKKL